MSIVHGRNLVGPDGTLRISLPSECANSEVEYTLQFHVPGENGEPRTSVSRRMRTGVERRESLRRLAGSIDDCTFVRPPQGDAESLESME